MPDAFEISEFKARREQSPPVTVAAEAEQLVGGKRSDQYGEPVDNMARTGAIWGALLGTDPIPPRMVAVMMVGLKLAREGGPLPSRDNLVDACGYLLIAELCGEGK